MWRALLGELLLVGIVGAAAWALVDWILGWPPLESADERARRRAGQAPAAAEGMLRHAGGEGAQTRSCCRDQAVSVPRPPTGGAS